MKKYKFLICGLIFVFVVCIVFKLANKNNYELSKIDIPFEYEMIPNYRTYDSYDNENKLYLIQNLDNECYGFIDTNGDIAIKPKYKSMLEFYDGLAAANDGEKWFYIDRFENVIIDNIYGNDITKLGNFYDGMAPLGTYKKGGYYLISSSGDILLEPTQETYVYSNYDVGNGIVNVFDELNDVYLKTINKNGEELEEIKNPIYLLTKEGVGFYKSTVEGDVTSIAEGDITSIVDEKKFSSDYYPYQWNYFGMYDLKNKTEITDVLFKSVSKFDEDGLSVVTLIENDDVCIVNIKGEVVINLTEKLSLNNDDVLNVSEIKDKKIIISLGKTFEEANTLLVDTKGNLISDKHKIVGTYSSGLAQIEKDGKYGYIGKNGNIVLEPIYDFVGRVYDGKSLVVNDSIMYKFTYLH